MPNIISQQVDATGLHVVASDGRSVDILVSDIAAAYSAQTGNVANRRLQTRTILKTTVVNAIGAEQVDPAYMDIDFDSGTFIPTTLEFRTPGG